MSVVQINGLNVSKSSYTRAREIVNNKPQGKKTTEEVLASLRKMMPGWTISTSRADWTEGVRNIEIDQRVLERMANDPEEMVKYKALILDLEETAPVLEQWMEENPDASLTFGLEIAANGAIQAIGIIKTLLGGEVRTVFDLAGDKTSWSSLIEQKLDALKQGKVEDGYGNRSWVV